MIFASGVAGKPSYPMVFYYTSLRLRGMPQFYKSVCSDEVETHLI